MLVSALTVLMVAYNVVIIPVQLLEWCLKGYTTIDPLGMI